MKVLMMIVCANLFLTLSVMAENKIKHCGNGATEVQNAINFIQANANTILNNTSGVDSKEKKRFKKKMESVNVKCLDDKPACRNHPSRGGVSRHLFNSAVVVCYERIKDFFDSSSYCKLVEVIAHEFAHTARVDKDRGHNDGPNNDEVYRLGYETQALCQSRGLDHEIRRK